MTATEPGTTVDERYRTALQQLWERSAYDRGFISNPFAGDETAQLGLKRTAALLERLGRPQDRYRILHVAGSKGKGSTCAFAASILQETGLRTGRYTSPHLHSFRERIAVDGERISERGFATTWERVLAAAEELESEAPEIGMVTAFELLTAMALDHFAQAGCDTAVIEVGLGGTLDATNVVEPASTLIAALDYEHTRVLGSTLAEIAANKAGIVKHGVPLATAPLPDEALEVVSDIAKRREAPWLLAGRDWRWTGSWRSFDVVGPWGSFHDLGSGLIGDHQVDNACLAIAGVWQMLGHDLSEVAVREGLAKVRWPGRFEIVQNLAGVPVVLDGAHTAAAARVLAQTYSAEFPGVKPVVLLGLLRDKDPLAIACALAPIAQRLVAVTPPGPRGLPAAELAQSVEPLDIEIETIDEIGVALTAAKGAPLLVSGSLTTVAAAREALGLGVPDPSFPE